MNSNLTIGELLKLQARHAAHDTFLHLPGRSQTVTFGDASTLAEKYGSYLRRYGVTAGERVIILLPNGLESAISMLAVMSIGAVAVPLNPRSTGDEIRQALSLSSARYVVCESALQKSMFSDFGTSQFSLNHDDDQAVTVIEMIPKSAVPEGQDKPVQPADPALILYTSGTTGIPKGVVLSHRNLLANALYVRNAHRLTSEDTALCLLPFFHINGLVVTLLTPLLTGQAVVVPARFDTARFWSWVGEYRVTWVSAVPTILSLLLSSAETPRKDALNTLRFARSASAPLPVAVLDKFERRFGVPVIETYGISEAACQVTANPMPPSVRKPGSAGRPIGNEMKIVGEAGSELPTGVTGEVIIRGDNIFGGYLDNPDADCEALRNGWFHTGDLGYLDEDGYLFLTGRKKELINRAGEKIAPREVEEVIHHLPEVETVGVVGVPNNLYGEEVAAFITLRSGRYLTREQVTGYCRDHLSGYKVPKEIFFIDDLPKGPSGKVQRRRLLDVYARITENNL